MDPETTRRALQLRAALSPLNNPNLMFTIYNYFLYEMKLGTSLFTHISKTHGNTLLLKRLLLRHISFAQMILESKKKCINSLPQKTPPNHKQNKDNIKNTIYLQKQNTRTLNMKILYVVSTLWHE